MVGFVSFYVSDDDEVGLSDCDCGYYHFSLTGLANERGEKVRILHYRDYFLVFFSLLATHVRRVVFMCVCASATTKFIRRPAYPGYVRHTGRLFRVVCVFFFRVYVLLAVAFSRKEADGRFSLVSFIIDVRSSSFFSTILSLYSTRRSITLISCRIPTEQKKSNWKKKLMDHAFMPHTKLINITSIYES